MGSWRAGAGTGVGLEGETLLTARVKDSLCFSSCCVLHFNPQPGDLGRPMKGDSAKLAEAHMGALRKIIYKTYRR